jgi:GT2 family glycosyltransferase
MKRQLRRMLRAVGGAGRPIPDEALQERSRGDEARDEKAWKKAADHYSAYLKAAPGDFGIRVQLGHMLKESGRLVEADAAYERALRQKPRDVDLLINYAHLKKMRHDWAAAHGLYERALRADWLDSVMVELAAPEMAQYLSPERRHDIETRSGAAIADRCDGLISLRSSHVVPAGDDRFGLTSDDPWIELAPAPSRESRGCLAELSITVSGLVDQRPLSGQLYVDYGSGYSEELKFHLGQQGKMDEPSSTTLFLAAPDKIKRFRWDPDDKGNMMRLTRIAFRPNVSPETARDIVRSTYPADMDVEDDLNRAFDMLDTDHLDLASAVQVTKLLAPGKPDRDFDYEFWLKRFISPRPADYDRIEEMTQAFERRPTFSFVMPVYNTPPELLVECIDSMLNQTYPHFEICIADDRSTSAEVGDILRRYAKQDSRVKYMRREINGHISAASNSAMALATGEYIVLVDHDDLIPDYCLFIVAYYLNQNPQARIVFSDEDKITIDGVRFSPYFKGDFDRFLLYGHNMVSHLGVYERALLQQIGGFRIGFEGSQDYDLLIRAMEIAGEDAILHIPHVLYHWRAIPGSTAVSADQKGYAITAAQRSINGHFERTATPLRSIEGIAPGLSAISNTREPTQKVSIIIPTRDGLDDLKACIDSVIKNPPENVEIIVVDNGSEQPATLKYFEALQRGRTATVISYPEEFNFSAINNFAVQHTTGDILCFLNNDTEVVNRNWVARARTLLLLDDVGMVGARLLYPDKTLQHFGLAAGMGAHGVAGAPHQGLGADDPGYFGKARLAQQFSAVTAACMFVKRSVFDAVGGFDEGLRVAYNDVDLCLKVRQAGFKIVGDPEVLLVHKESKTRGSDDNGEKALRLEAEAALMRERWGTTLSADPFWSPNLSDKRDDFALANPPRVPMPWRLAKGDL